MADWANLPTDILYLIANRAHCMEDFLAFCAVCKSWNLTSSVPALPPRFPWVMLPDESFQWKEHPWTEWIQAAEEINFANPIRRRFHSLSTSKIHEFELPEAAGRKCLGTSYGSLMTVGYDLQINLLHAFSRQQISLPSLLTFQEQYPYNYEFTPQHVVDVIVDKVVLSRNPWIIGCEDDCIVVVIYGDQDELSFARLGDRAWTHINASFKGFQDIMYWNGSFYAVNYCGDLFICEIDSDRHGPRATIIAKGRPRWAKLRAKKRDRNIYITESSGDVLLVNRRRKRTFGRTTGFSIYRLEKLNADAAEYPYSWTKVKGLGNRSLFVGNNASSSLSSSDVDCVKANCIYFSEDAWVDKRHPGRDTGIYHLANKSIEKHSVAKFCCPFSLHLVFIFFFVTAKLYYSKTGTVMVQWCDCVSVSDSLDQALLVWLHPK